jgi:hypothetical protein
MWDKIVQKVVTFEAQDVLMTLGEYLKSLRKSIVSYAKDGYVSDA